MSSSISGLLCSNAKVGDPVLKDGSGIDLVVRRSGVGAYDLVGTGKMVSQLCYRQLLNGCCNIGSVDGAEEGSHNFLIDTFGRH